MNKYKYCTSILEHCKKYGIDEASRSDNNFAAACYNGNSISELQGYATDAPDKTDIKTWGLSGVREWRNAVSAAYHERIADRRPISA